MTVLDDIVHDPRFLPYRGWHDDHRHAARTPGYLPAMQQARTEFHAFADLLRERGLRQRCLQLGLGYSGASHVVFKSMFEDVRTVEWAQARVANLASSGGCTETIIVGDTHSLDTLGTVWADVAANGPFDLLFIDAAHTIADVNADFHDYAPFVRAGGMVAFHDALDRNGHEVHRFLDALRATGETITIIGDELGIAWVQVS